MEEINEKRYCVYKHTSPNDKVYIGITYMKPEKRWNNGLGYKKNTYFWRAIQKYGWNNFAHEILYDNLSQEEACSKEIELIQFYDSTNKEKGYNLSTGGDRGALGVVRSEETKQKLRDHNTGKHPSTETVQKMIKNSATRKDVVQFDLNGNIIAEFLSAKEAARQTGVADSNINQCCKNMSITAGGYKWKYKQDVIAVGELCFKEDNSKKPVLQFNKDGEFIAEYESGRCAERELGLNHGVVMKCCNGTTRSGGGYVWRYKNDDYNIDELKYQERIFVGRSVLQFTKDGELIASYETIRQAGRCTGIERNNIGRCCKRIVNSAGGFVWRYSDDILDIEEIKSNKYYGSYNNNPILQFDLSGNFIAEYKNSVEAEKATGVGYSNIKRCCRGEQKTAGGFKWYRKDVYDKLTQQND